MPVLQLAELPAELSELRTLALDLRWTWSHEADALWEQVDAGLWRQTRNPWKMLQNVPRTKLEQLARDTGFCAQLADFSTRRKQYFERPGWFPGVHDRSLGGGVAYFSMEFGLGAALPLYAGGLGVLAGDYLKTMSDLDVPAVGVGLLYQEGYFRQIINAEGIQHELYPYNEPAVMPIEPVLLGDGEQLRVRLPFPGRSVHLRIWQAVVGRTRLYLLDSNDPLNSPADQGITAKLYAEGSEVRLMQEIVLGIGGWRAIRLLRPDVELCHINEGHAAFAIIERARQTALDARLGLQEALWASRGGNLFSTHTPVASGFDQFPARMVEKYLRALEEEAPWGADVEELIRLGQAETSDPGDIFNMAWLAQRGSALTLGVSRLHGQFSRHIFQPLFPRLPLCEVPIGHVTNGVHIPSWDSRAADKLWTAACGKERWRGMPGELKERIGAVPDEDLWAMRNEGRLNLVQAARRRLFMQLRGRGLNESAARQADLVLDPGVLTLGFARRFTDYKRPNLLLEDRVKLEALLLDEKKPVQIVVAGKAHPADRLGKEMISAWIALARKPEFRRHVVFLEDYDIALAQELVQGVDVWINTPRPPWEACGTSGMKILVNGGLNCSVRDGWWDEAFSSDLGWAIGDGQSDDGEHEDARDAQSLYALLNNEIIPEFYQRDARGLPRAWLKRIRSSMSALTPRFSGTRMARDYIETAYLPLANKVNRRGKDNYALARALSAWSSRLTSNWQSLRMEPPTMARIDDHWLVSARIFLGQVAPDDIRVELFADQSGQAAAQAVPLYREREIPGFANAHVYAGLLAAGRPAEDYTLRIVPFHPEAELPAELPLIAWQR